MRRFFTGRTRGRQLRQRADGRGLVTAWAFLSACFGWFLVTARIYGSNGTDIPLATNDNFFTTYRAGTILPYAFLLRSPHLPHTWRQPPTPLPSAAPTRRTVLPHTHTRRARAARAHCGWALQRRGALRARAAPGPRASPYPPACLSPPSYLPFSPTTYLYCMVVVSCSFLFSVQAGTWRFRRTSLSRVFQTAGFSLFPKAKRQNRLLYFTPALLLCWTYCSASSLRCLDCIPPTLCHVLQASSMA